MSTRLKGVKFSVITQMTGHFFLEQLEKDFLRDTLKAFEIVEATFKRIPSFLTDDNLITTLCSVIFNYTDRSHIC